MSYLGNVYVHTCVRAYIYIFLTGNTRSLDQGKDHLLFTEHLNLEPQSPQGNSIKA